MRKPFDATGTIGHRPCEVSLNKILAERNDPKLIRAITKLIHHCKAGLKAIQELSDMRLRVYFADLMRDDIEKKIAEITGVAVRGVPVTDVVASHTMCCVASYFRELDLGHRRPTTPPGTGRRWKDKPFEGFEIVPGTPVQEPDGD